MALREGRRERAGNGLTYHPGGDLPRQEGRQPTGDVIHAKIIERSSKARRVYSKTRRRRRPAKPGTKLRLARTQLYVRCFPSGDRRLHKGKAWRHSLVGAPLFLLPTQAWFERPVPGNNQCAVAAEADPKRLVSQAIRVKCCPNRIDIYCYNHNNRNRHAATA